MSSKIKTLVFTAVMHASAAIAQDVDVRVYQEPVVKARVNPEYPNRPLRFLQEGTVELNLMVDTTGKPFEVVVTNSTGAKEFGEAALKAVNRWTFEPASLNGEPIVGSKRLLLKFQMDAEPAGASRQFINAYKKFSEGLPALSREETEQLLGQLSAAGGNNRYESAFMSQAHYMFAGRYGSTIEQMEHLDASLSFSRVKEDAVFLPEESALAARRELMKLQIKNQYFKEALTTYAYFIAVEDKEAVEAFKPVVDQVREIENNDIAYEIPVTLDDMGNFDIDLLKHNVYITAVAGKVDEFKLRCETKYFGLPVEADISYDIPETLGSCSLQILGEPGSTMKLVQH